MYYSKSKRKKFERMCPVNYEVELVNTLKRAISNQYQVKEKWLEYFFFRYSVATQKSVFQLPKVTLDIEKFLLQELKIPYEREGMIYKDTLIPFGFRIGHSVGNVIENWVNDWIGFEERTDKVQRINDILQEAWKYARNKNKLKNNHLLYHESLKGYSLIFGNKHYHAIPNGWKEIEGITYEDELLYIRSLDERLQGVLDTIKQTEKEASCIKEEDIEAYIFTHLNELEEGLRPLKRQLIIEDARIDIWARDKQGVDVLIEIKLAPDSKELCWQVLYYPALFKRMYHKSNVRMLTVTPILIPSLQEAMDSISIVEQYTYTTDLHLGKLVSLSMKKMDSDYLMKI